MGKKNKKEKKGKGKEKTLQKTEKNANKKLKKEIGAKGEEDIEQIIAEFMECDKKKSEVVEEKCAAPSPRSNMTLKGHPDKDELIMFGGEYDIGNKVFLYNDLFMYNIKKREWLKVSVPNPPPPRCAHQAVVMKQGGGQMWLFGGEFSSPTQTQFYHYKDLWVYHLKAKQWEKISAPGGPSARSGHRMTQSKKTLFVFGGYNDNGRSYQYFNDVHSFNLETYTWTKIEAVGTGPSPRSGCLFSSSLDQVRLIVYGGYSKKPLKKDTDEGMTYSDMFALVPDGKTAEGTMPSKWKWTAVKQSGAKPSPRSGMSYVQTLNNRLVCFGGVFDEEENEESLSGKFYNQLLSLELEKAKWHEIILRGSDDSKLRKKRRKQKEDTEGECEEDDEGQEMEIEEDLAKEDDEGQEIEEDIEKLQLTNADQSEQCSDANNTCNSNSAQPSKEVVKESVFTVTVGPQTEASVDSACSLSDVMDIFKPSARMNPVMAVHSNTLFMYGGLFEDGDKQMTLKDFYSLDLHKTDEWVTLIEADKTQVWDESDSDDDEAEGACGGKRAAEDSDSDDDDSDDDMEITFDDAPDKEENENVKYYFLRTKEYWLKQAKTVCEEDDMGLSAKQLENLAKDMCESCFSGS